MMLRWSPGVRRMDVIPKGLIHGAIGVEVSEKLEKAEGSAMEVV